MKMKMPAALKPRANGSANMMEPMVDFLMSRLLMISRMKGMVCWGMFFLLPV